MKKMFLLLFGLVLNFTYAQKIPDILKTEFSKEALEQTVINPEEKEVSIQSVFDKHRGKVIVLEFWAGWCRDCLIGMPASHRLRENNPEVDFVYFSLDRNLDSWKKGIEKHELGIGDNYWFHVGWENSFTHYIDLNWVPRYMVIDRKGKIAKYYAVSADDPEIQETINKLLTE